jgi:hypothetical protein
MIKPFMLAGSESLTPRNNFPETKPLLWGCDVTQSLQVVLRLSQRAYFNNRELGRAIFIDMVPPVCY